MPAPTRAPARHRFVRVSHVELARVAGRSWLPVARAARPQRAGGRGVDRGRGAAAHRPRLPAVAQAAGPRLGQLPGPLHAVPDRSASRSSCSAYAAGEAANRRGDARVLLISLAFLATGGFLGLHALGTAGVLFAGEHAGFKVANPVGPRHRRRSSRSRPRSWTCGPSFAPFVVRHRAALRRGPCSAPWPCGSSWTVADLPPLREPGSEGGSHSVLATLAGIGAVRLRRRGRALLARLPRPDRPPAGQHHRLLRPARRGDDRRGADRRARLARELVGVARPDRHRLRCVVGYRRAARVARRALPRPLPRHHARARPARERAVRRPRRLHGVHRARRARREVVEPARHLLRPRRAARSRAASAATWRSSSGDGLDGDVQQPRRRARPRRARGRRRAGAPARAVARSPTATRAGRGRAWASTAASRSSARWAATGSSATRWSATSSTRRPGSRAMPRWAACSSARRRAGRCRTGSRRRARAGAARQGPPGGGRRVPAAGGAGGGVTPARRHRRVTGRGSRR